MAKLYETKLKGKANPNYRGGKIKKICYVCHSQYYLTAALAKRSRFCSYHCTIQYRKTDEYRKEKSRLAKKNKLGKWMKGRFREASHSFKGGRRKTKLGYILILDRNHPNRNKTTHCMSEHRLVMEKKIGRYLHKKEVVHHLNGVKDDNRIENLALCNNRTHSLYIRALQNKIKELDEELQNVIDRLKYHSAY